MDFTLINGSAGFSNASTIEKDPTIALTRGTFCSVDLTSGAPLAVVGTVAATQLAFVMEDAPIGTTEVRVLSNSDVVFEGLADATITDAMKNTKVDLVYVSGRQRVDVGASTTDVFTIPLSNNFTRTDEVTGVTYIRVKLTNPFVLL